MDQTVMRVSRFQPELDVNGRGFSAAMLRRNVQLIPSVFTKSDRFRGISCDKLKMCNAAILL